ncbi:hypothetical protein WV31_16100 [Magnetospirillum sp. ME-1]|uniref:OmpA family protein n=1 Tax=Magnetospirillum sp. ME-1 TaxID=1639348 RepID=UPI000A17FB7A|nr:OmpA family protein [Magnetospirillum sp. ME-1]ARJ67081.1 hypothetical protein WV31_16100 [Magnetospirillum sp. ME-1]
MTDSRRDFLLRFAATALAAAGAGCDSQVEAVDESLSARDRPLVVYGPPPRHGGLKAPREVEINFASGSLELDAKARAILDELAEMLRRDLDQPVILDGHADQQGSREYNLAVSERRLTVVQNYLIERAGGPRRFITRAFGRERPKVAGTSKAAMAANRRVVIRLEPY